MRILAAIRPALDRLQPCAHLLHHGLLPGHTIKDGVVRAARLRVAARRLLPPRSYLPPLPPALPPLLLLVRVRVRVRDWVRVRVSVRDRCRVRVRVRVRVRARVRV